MKVTWYLPVYHELQLGKVFGGALVATYRAGAFGTPFISIQDMKKGYNVCRIDYDKGEFTPDELHTLGENYKLLAELQLDNVRNKHGTAI